MTFRHLITNVLLFPVMPMLQFGGGGSGIQETADTKQEQINNTKLYNYYNTTYKPFIDKSIKLAETDASSDARAKKVAGQVNAEAMKGASANVGKPDAVTTTKQMNAAAGVKSDATVDALGNVRKMQLGQEQSFVDIGRGQQTQTQQLGENLAEQSVRKAISDKEIQTQNDAMIANSVGAVAGVAGAVGKRALSGRGATDPSSVSYGVMQNNENTGPDPQFGQGQWF